MKQIEEKEYNKKQKDKTSVAGKLQKFGTTLEGFTFGCNFFYKDYSGYFKTSHDGCIFTHDFKE